MKSFSIRFSLTFAVFFSLLTLNTHAHEIKFCGEVIPLSEEFVVNKLMNVIRRQMPVANMPELKRKTLSWFPWFEKIFKYYGIPEDFKYLPIVESGFRNAVSPAGAAGIWQLLPEVAREYKLTVNNNTDERNDWAKATYAACQLLKFNYKSLEKRTGKGSWILTAAAYNVGIGSIMNTMSRQGNDYFKMNLNAETAEYVYKLIAVKELFENPEIYMSGFGSNVFTTNEKKEAVHEATEEEDLEEFKSMSIDMTEKRPKISEPKKQRSSYYVRAHIIPAEKEFKDNNLVTLELEDNLDLPGKFIRKGNTIKGNGWQIDGRVFINLGYGHAVQVMDGLLVKGIPISEIDEDKQTILLKVSFN